MKIRAPMLEIIAKPQYPQTANTNEMGEVQALPQFFSKCLAMTL